LYLISHQHFQLFGFPFPAIFASHLSSMISPCSSSGFGPFHDSWNLADDHVIEFYPADCIFKSVVVSRRSVMLVSAFNGRRRASFFISILFFKFPYSFLLMSAQLSGHRGCFGRLQLRLFFSQVCF